MGAALPGDAASPGSNAQCLRRSVRASRQSIMQLAVPAEERPAVGDAEVLPGQDRSAGRAGIFPVHQPVLARHELPPPFQEIDTVLPGLRDQLLQLPRRQVDDAGFGVHASLFSCGFRPPMHKRPVAADSPTSDAEDPGTAIAVIEHLPYLLGRQMPRQRRKLPVPGGWQCACKFRRNLPAKGKVPKKGSQCGADQSQVGQAALTAGAVLDVANQHLCRQRMPTRCLLAKEVA